MHFSLFENNFVYLSLAYRTKRYRKYQNIHILLFHLRAIFSEPGSSSQHGKPFLLKGNFIIQSIFNHHKVIFRRQRFYPILPICEENLYQSTCNSYVGSSNQENIAVSVFTKLHYIFHELKQYCIAQFLGLKSSMQACIFTYTKMFRPISGQTTMLYKYLHNYNMSSVFHNFLYSRNNLPVIILLQSGQHSTEALYQAVLRDMS